MITDYPLVNIQKAIENDNLIIVDFPIENSDFPISFFVCLPGRVPSLIIIPNYTPLYPIKSHYIPLNHH